MDVLAYGFKRVTLIQRKPLQCHHTSATVFVPFAKRFIRTGIKENTEVPHYLPFCAGNSPVTRGFPHKGSVMRKAGPCHDAIKDKASYTVKCGRHRRVGLYKDNDTSCCFFTRLVLGLRPANERRLYKVTPSFSNAVSHWLGANLESVLFHIWHMLTW